MNAIDLAKLLDELGQRLGPTGAHVFELAVRQVYVNAAVSIVTLAVWALVGKLSYRTVAPLTSIDRDDLGIGGSVVSILWVGFGLIATIAAFFTVPAVFNPEYAALRDILSAIGGAK